jgi:hypothetical protein
MLTTENLIVLTIIFHAFRTWPKPSAIAAEKPVCRRIDENVTILALVNRNDISIVGWQYILSPINQYALLLQVSLKIA